MVCVFFSLSALPFIQSADFLSTFFNCRVSPWRVSRPGNKLLFFSNEIKFSAPPWNQLCFLEVWLQDDHTKPQHMAEVQVHLRPVDKKMNGPLARRNFFTSPVRCHYCKKSLAANPKSTQVHRPLGMPRNSKPLSAEGSALLLVPKDGDHIRGEHSGLPSREERKTPELTENTEEMPIRHTVCFLLQYSSTIISQIRSNRPVTSPFPVSVSPFSAGILILIIFTATAQTFGDIKPNE